MGMGDGTKGGDDLKKPDIRECVANLLKHMVLHKIAPGAVYESFDDVVTTNKSDKPVYVMFFTDEEAGDGYDARYV